jgi:hypothetical protein
MRDEQVPDNRLESLRVRCDPGGNDDHSITASCRVASVAPHDAENGSAPLFRQVDGVDKIRADFFSRSPPPTEKTNTASFSFDRLVSSHAAKTVGQPSSFVRAVSSETLSVGA